MRVHGLRLGRGMLLAAALTLVGASGQAAPPGPPGSVKPLPDLRIRTIVANCQKIGSHSKITVHLTLDNKTGTPTGSGFVTKVHVVGVREEPKARSGEAPFAFTLSQTHLAGFTAGAVTVEKTVPAPVLSYHASAAVDADQQVQEHNEGNNQVGTPTFSCP